MTTKPRSLGVRAACLHAALLCLMLDGRAVRAQDQFASTLITAPATGLLVRLPLAVAPALDRARQEAFLRSAPISKVRGVKTGVTGTQRAALSKAGIVHDASIQTVDELKARFDTSTSIELQFRDYWGYNVAAYRLAVLLGLENIPVSVERRFRSQQASFTWWIEDVLMDE